MSEQRFDISELEEGQGLRLSLQQGDSDVAAFAVRFDGKVQVYENRCPHLGVELDWAPGEFIDDELQKIICSTHGALFEPSSGFCVAGPCAGQVLNAIEFVVQDTTLIIKSDD